MIKFKHKGNFNSTERFLKSATKVNYRQILAPYGEAGVAALASATPMDTGLTAASWEYDIIEKNGSVSIVWSNTNVVNGTPIAIILQYGHATRNGGFVEGRDYVNPAIKPLFDKMANDIWKAVNP
ncbi:MAG: HK97 gp10 family phage protein [Alphaproteobacteria bacterium]|nr:HK97 gp10 family phage protein [Alphaproteobacteria bacterium]